MEDNYSRCDACGKIFQGLPYCRVTMGEKFEPFLFKPSFQVKDYLLHLCPQCYLKTVQEWESKLPAWTRAKEYIRLEEKTRKLGLDPKALGEFCARYSRKIRRLAIMSPLAIRYSEEWLLSPDFESRLQSRASPRRKIRLTLEEIKVLKYLLLRKATATRIADDCGVEFNKVSAILLKGMAEGLIQGEKDEKGADYLFLLTKYGEDRVEEILTS